MGSLRDQLLAKGVATKRQAREAKRALRRSRKDARGSREKKQAEAAKEAEALECARRERRKEASEQRSRRAAEQERMQHALTIRNVVERHRVRGAGRYPFYFRKGEGSEVGRLWVSDQVAFGLRCGDLGIATLSTASGGPHFVISRHGVERLRALDQQRVVFHVVDTRGLSDPSLAFEKREWEPSLRARRVRLEDPGQGADSSGGGNGSIGDT